MPNDTPSEGVQALTAQYATRLPAADADHVHDALTAGETAWGLQELTTALVLADAALTDEERDHLQTLGNAVGLDLTVLDALASTPLPPGVEQTRGPDRGRDGSSQTSRHPGRTDDAQQDIPTTRQLRIVHGSADVPRSEDAQAAEQ